MRTGDGQDRPSDKSIADLSIADLANVVAEGFVLKAALVSI
jgi:hypothetical protein